MLLKSNPSRSNYTPRSLDSASIFHSMIMPSFYNFLVIWDCSLHLPVLNNEKRGCFPQTEGSITSRLMTGRVPDCRQAPCTCFNCASFLYISTENAVCLLFFSKGWWSHRSEHLLDFSTSSTYISEAFFRIWLFWVQKWSCVISICRWNAVFFKSQRE